MGFRRWRDAEFIAHHDSALLIRAKGADPLTGIDVGTLYSRIADAWSSQLFRDGIFHCDPHPGNFLALEHAEAGSVPVVLDFGMVKRVTDVERLALCRGLVGLRRRAPAPHPATDNVPLVLCVIYLAKNSRCVLLAPLPSILLVASHLRTLIHKTSLTVFHSIRLWVTCTAQQRSRPKAKTKRSSHTLTNRSADL